MSELDIHLSNTEQYLTIFQGNIGWYLTIFCNIWQYLRISSNEWERLAVEIGYAFKSVAERDRDVVEKVYEADSHVILMSPVEALFYQELEYFKGKELPVFHISRERLR